MTNSTSQNNQTFPDRNFDDIAEHFGKKIYNSRKGKIRLAVLWHDIENYLKSLPKDTKLNVLDIGGGFGHIAQKLAMLGHSVTVNDISANMLEQAQHMAQENGVTDIQFIHAPYQELPSICTQTYDLVLCHAVLEWLEKPADAIPVFKSLLSDTGTLSLCFYNPVAKVYRNLILGNFKNIDKVAQQKFTSTKRSLTPNNPSNIEDVLSWIHASSMKIVSETGVRVFSDYVYTPMGGHEYLDAVIEKEIEYGKLTPYKHMGRYYHVLATK